MTLMQDRALRWNSADFVDWGGAVGSGGSDVIQPGFTWSGTYPSCGAITGTVQTPNQAMIRIADSRFAYAGGYYVRTNAIPGAFQAQDCHSSMVGCSGVSMGAGEGSEEWYLIPVRPPGAIRPDQTGWFTIYQYQQAIGGYTGWGGFTHASMGFGMQVGATYYGDSLSFTGQFGRRNEPWQGPQSELVVQIPLLGATAGSCFPGAPIPPWVKDKWYWVLIRYVWGSGCPTGLNPAGYQGSTPGGWNGNGTWGDLEIWLISEDGSDFTKLYTNTAANDAVMNWRTSAVYSAAQSFGFRSGSVGAAVADRASGHPVGCWNVTNGCAQEFGTAFPCRSSSHIGWTPNIKAMTYSAPTNFTRSVDLGPFNRVQSLDAARALLGITGGAPDPPANDPDVHDTLGAVAGGDARYGVTTILGANYQQGGGIRRGTTVLVAQGLSAEWLYAYLPVQNGAGVEKIKLYVYAVVNGAPTVLVAQTAEKTITYPIEPGWLKLPLSPPVSLPAGIYEVGSIVRNGNATNCLTIAGAPSSGAGTYAFRSYDAGLADPAGAFNVYDFQLCFAIEGELAGGGGGPTDTVKPTVAQLSTSLIGSSLYLDASEPLDPAFVPVAGQFVVTVNGTPATLIAGTPITVSGSRVEIRFLPTVQFSDPAAPTLTYTKSAPTNIKDLAGNEMDAFGPLVVENLATPAAAPPAPPPAVRRRSRAWSPRRPRR